MIFETPHNISWNTEIQFGVSSQMDETPRKSKQDRKLYIKNIHYYFIFDY